MQLTKEQVKKVAKLANLPITSEEEELYSGQLSKILGYIEQLNGVDTLEVEPTFNVTTLKNIFREDIVGKSLTQEEALANAPKNNKGFFVTKGVFGEE